MIIYDKLFSSFPRLEAQRVVLEQITMQDYLPFLNMCNESEYKELFLDPGEYISENDAKRCIEVTCPESFQNRTEIAFAIKAKVNSHQSFLIGERMLFIDSPFSPIETQGYIRTEYRDQGLNQEAMHLIELFLKEAKVELLKFNCKSENERVIHYAAKLGYIKTGVGQTSFEFTKKLQ